MQVHAYAQSGACDYSVLRYVFAAEWVAHDPVYRAGGGRPFRAGNGDANGGEVSHGSQSARTIVEDAARAGDPHGCAWSCSAKATGTDARQGAPISDHDD